MAKEKNAVASPFFRELFQFGVYKRSQGKIARQVTFATLALVLAIGAWRLSQFVPKSTLGLIGTWRSWGTGEVALPDTISVTVWALLPWMLLVLGVWISYRLVNMPSFADFLIAVEAEMNKVSWPTRAELFRSSVVVIISIFLLALILFGYDMFWSKFLDLLGIGHK